jgi:hypothetical protein
MKSRNSSRFFPIIFSIRKILEGFFLNLKEEFKFYGRKVWKAPIWGRPAKG